MGWDELRSGRRQAGKRRPRLVTAQVLRLLAGAKALAKKEQFAVKGPESSPPLPPAMRSSPYTCGFWRPGPGLKAGLPVGIPRRDTAVRLVPVAAPISAPRVGPPLRQRPTTPIARRRFGETPTPAKVYSADRPVTTVKR